MTVQRAHPAQSPLRIGLLFDDSLDRMDGVQQYVKSLGGYFTAQGHHVAYLVGQTAMTEYQNAPVYSLSKNIRVTFNHNRLSMPVWASGRHIKQALAKEELDIVHVMVPYSPLMAGKVIRRFSAHGPLVGTFHIMPAGGLSALGSRLLAIASPGKKKFMNHFAVSEPAARFAASHFGIEAEVLPNVVDVARFNVAPARPALAEGKAHVVFLGRLVRRKGCMVLLQALDLIRAQGQLDAMHVTILGDGPDKEQLLSFAAEHSLLSHVTFHGYVDEALKPALLASADVAVFPSLGGESFGIVLLEAMAAGAGAVIGGNNPGYNSVLSHCGTPEALFAPTATELAQVLQRFALNSADRNSLHVKQQAALRQFDVRTVGNRLIDVYHDAIANYRSSADNKAI
jgi:phosphatidyl-myo-inositol alpha-mannosyltransferase